MHFYGFEGTSIILQFLFWSSIIIVSGVFSVTVFSIFYHKYLYPSRISKRYDESYKPPCAVIIPCKGLPKDFEMNIASFPAMDYPSFELFFTVESDSDPAVPIIRKLIQSHRHAFLVVSGITKTSSQKNHNMIAAIEMAKNAEVYVFADSDIRIHKNWLGDMIKPLSNRKMTATTGFRWLYSPSGSMGELANAYQNSLLLVMFSFASFVNDIGLWGGSMAIRRKDFEDLKVKEYWAQTVVDDISLSRLIRKNSRKSVMVSSCIIPTDDALQTVKRSIFWFQRQVMFLKAYQKKMWFSAVAVVFVCLPLQLLLPVSLALCLCTDATFTETGAAPALIFLLGSMVSTILFSFLGKQPALTRTLLLLPVSQFTVVFGTIQTLFTNTVLWSGFKYKINFRGKVTSVKQL